MVRRSVLQLSIEGRGDYNLGFVLKEGNLVLIERQFYYSLMLVCSRRYGVLLFFNCKLNQESTNTKERTNA